MLTGIVSRTTMPPGTGPRFGTGTRTRTGITVLTGITIITKVNKRGSPARRAERPPTPMPRGEAPIETGLGREPRASEEDTGLPPTEPDWTVSRHPALHACMSWTVKT